MAEYSFETQIGQGFEDNVEQSVKDEIDATLAKFTGQKELVDTQAGRELADIANSTFKYKVLEKLQVALNGGSSMSFAKFIRQAKEMNRQVEAIELIRLAESDEIGSTTVLKEKARDFKNLPKA